MPKKMGAFGKDLLKRIAAIIEEGTLEDLQAFWPYLTTYKEQFKKGIDAVLVETNLSPEEISKKLTQKENELFLIFLRHIGEELSYEAIQGAIWGEKDNVEGNLGNLVRRLRKKVEPHYRIHNIRGYGYCME